MSGQTRRTGFSVNGTAGWGSDGAPAWRGGGNNVWWHPKALAALDFTNGRALRNPTEVALTSICALTRASITYVQNAACVWQSFAADALAQVSGEGTSIYGSFTNKIRNPRGEGGVVGAVGVTNKCTGYNAKPPALVTMGSAAAFNSVFPNLTADDVSGSTTFGCSDATAALQTVAASDPFIAAGLANGWLSGRAYEINNAGVSGNSNVLIAGLSGNTNQHFGSAYIWGSGSVIIGTNLVTPSSFAVTATPTRYTQALTPTSTGNRLRINALPGAHIWFILFQFNEAATATPAPTVVAGAAATGALPTNWSTTGKASNGLDVVFMGAGTENGLPYTSIRFVGTTTSTTNAIYFEPGATIAASDGQAWGVDLWTKLVSGTAPSGFSAFVAGTSVSGASASPTSTITRSFASGVLTGSSAYIRPYYSDPVLNSTAYDFTVRIYAPKLVQLAVITSGELNPDPNFSSSSGWALDLGFAILGNKLVATAPISGSKATRAPSTPIVSGAVYRLDSIIGTATIAGGGLVPRLSGTAGSVPHSTVASFTDYFVGTSTNTFGIQSIGVGGFTGSLTSASLKQVTPGYLPAIPILPLAGVPGEATRAADVALVSSFAPAIVSGLVGGGSALLSAMVSHTGDCVTRVLFEVSDNSADYVIRASLSTSDRPVLAVVRGGVSEVLCELPYAVAAGPVALAFGWSASGGYIADRAGNSVSFGAITLPSGLSRLQIGGGLAGQYINDRLKQMQICAPLTLAEAKGWTAAA